MRWHSLFSLKYRIAACIFVLEAVMMFIVLAETLQFSEENTRRQLAESEQVTLDVFADLSQNALFTRDFGDLQQYAEKLTKDPHVLKVIVVGRDRKIVVSTDFSDLGRRPPVRFRDGEERFWRTRVVGNLGMIAIEFSNREVIEASRRMVNRGIAIAVIGMVIIAVAGVGFGFLLTRRLKTVSDAASRLAAGDLGVRTGITGHDEVSIVGRTFDRMAAQIQHDISTLEDRQRALARARDELEVRVAERTLELRAASEAKSEFLATMSHEMRTPLNGVVGAAELLADKPLPATERKLVDWLLASSRQLRSLIDSLLDLRRIEAGKMAIERAPFDLHALMDRLAALFEPEARRVNLGFEQSIAADVPRMLVGDDARIRQVLINLTANALKFTREGRISVGVGVLAQSGADVTLRFEVRDTGIGIAPEDATRVFDRFAQANAGIHRQYGGSGLGTTICKHLVELMGGTIGFDSRPGAGTTFWFTVPLGRQTGELPREDAAGTGEQPPAGVPGLRVLVAEDNPMNQQIITMMLRGGGHDVTVAGDGDSVIEQLRNLRFDALVLDMHMPGRTGLEVARAVRALEAQGKTQRTPIIMLTAAAGTDVQQSAIDAGVDLFLSKPVEPRVLLNGVKGVFEGARESRTPARGDYVDRDLLRDMARLAADPGFMASFTGRFTREASRIIDEIEAALAQGDFDRSRELAHSLKGTAAITGAVRLGDSAARLETLSGADLGDAGPGVLRDLRATLDATSDELARGV